MHHLDSWIKIDQLDVTCFIISLFTAQHVSNVGTSIFRRLRLIVDLFHVCFSLHKDTTPPQPNHTVTPTHIEPEQYNPWNKSTISRKLLKMDVLSFETCWAVNSEIIKQVASSWSIFIHLFFQFTTEFQRDLEKNQRVHRGVSVQFFYLLTDTRTLSLGYRRLKSEHRGLKISATALNSASSTYRYSCRKLL